MESRGKKNLKKEGREEGGVKGKRDGEMKIGWRIGETNLVSDLKITSAFRYHFANFSHTSISK